MFLMSLVYSLRVQGDAKSCVHIWTEFPGSMPRSGSGGVRIDPLRFLAGCRKRQLNRSLSTVFLLVLVLIVLLLLGLLHVSLCWCVFCLLDILVNLSVLAK